MLCVSQIRPLLSWQVCKASLTSGENRLAVHSCFFTLSYTISFQSRKKRSLLYFMFKLQGTFDNRYLIILAPWTLWNVHTSFPNILYEGYSFNERNREKQSGGVRDHCLSPAALCLPHHRIACVCVRQIGCVCIRQIPYSSHPTQYPLSLNMKSSLNWEYWLFNRTKKKRRQEKNLNDSSVNCVPKTSWQPDNVNENNHWKLT